MPNTAEVSVQRREARVGYLLARSERSIRAELDGVTPRHGLSTPAYTALSVLKDRPGLSSAELARASFVTPQAMQPFVTSLQDAALIERRPDPANRRILRITLTQKGEGVLLACDRDVDLLEARALEGLSARDIATLRRALRSMTKNLGGLDVPPTVGEGVASNGGRRA